MAQYVGGDSGVGSVVGDQVAQCLAEAVAGRAFQVLAEFSANLLRWSVFKNDEPASTFKTVGEKVFPFLRDTGRDGSTYGQHMKDVRFTVPAAQLLSRVIGLARHRGDTPNTYRC